MEISYWILIFVCSLYVLVKAADYFIESAEQIGLGLRVPSFIIGATLVSMGTSLPELVSSIIAVQGGTSEIVVGNVVGSNISNIFFILGLTMLLVRRLPIPFAALRFDYMFLLGSAVMLLYFLWDLQISTMEIALCLAVMVFYLVFVIRFHPFSGLSRETEHLKATVNWTTYVFAGLSAGLIYLGARYTIESIQELSLALNIGPEIIALSAVSLGTSLPELVVSIAAARKGMTEVLIGNIIGSNIFNSLFVIGLPACFGSLLIPAEINSFSLPLMMLATVLLVVMGVRKGGGKITGLVFLLLYAFFIAGIFLRLQFF